MIRGLGEGPVAGAFLQEFQPLPAMESAEVSAVMLQRGVTWPSVVVQLRYLVGVEVKPQGVV